MLAIDDECTAAVSEDLGICRLVCRPSSLISRGMSFVPRVYGSGGRKARPYVFCKVRVQG